MNKAVKVRDILVGNGSLTLIAGPCVLEERDVVLTIAEELKTICCALEIPLIFKSSYLKDNRTTALSYRGPGLDKGLRLLEEVRNSFEVPVISDIHSEAEAQPAADVLDVLQIPAFLCRQTSLLLAAGKTGKPVNIKKGQFLSPEAMSSPIGKIESTGNNNIILTERGSCFGYNRLVVDICSIPIMKKSGYPVFIDATHAVRNYEKPSASQDGGYPEFIPALVYAGTAAGCDGLFIETHKNPADAKCDASSMLPLSRLKKILITARKIHETIY